MQQTRRDELLQHFNKTAALPEHILHTICLAETSQKALQSTLRKQSDFENGSFSTRENVCFYSLRLIERHWLASWFMRHNE